MFFFFKQKTAYEMRISDWSSDVCSSDLLVIIEDALARYLDPPGMPVDPHNLATKPQLDIAFLIKAGMAQWQTADVSRDLERLLATGGPTILHVRFFAQDHDPARKAYLPLALASPGRSIAANEQKMGFIGEQPQT